MSHWDRILGVARSIAVYHAIPMRRRRMRRLYAQFVAPGDLVFDVGAHAGNRVRGFAALGCHVVALEPQPDFARLLRTVFGRSRRRIDVVEMAVGDAAGRAVLSVSERTPTVTTLAPAWREARAGEPDFAGSAESSGRDDDARPAGRAFGDPVHQDRRGGGGPAVLGGLQPSVPALSFGTCRSMRCVRASRAGHSRSLSLQLVAWRVMRTNPLGG
jgi:hypothetical protein